MPQLSRSEATQSSALAYMSLRADMYRQKAAAAKQSAARASNPSIKSAFEEVARGWLVLAEQIVWMEDQKTSTPERDD